MAVSLRSTQRVLNGLIRLSAAVLIAFAAASGVAGETLLEHGNYLVNGIMTCDHCHTPKDKAGAPVMDRKFAGGSQRFNEIPFSATGSNITPDRETGIGAWSDADIKRALTEGTRPNGVRLATVMPYPLFRVLTPRDLDAVVAYLRSVAPIRNEVASPVYKMQQVPYTFPGAEKPMSEADLQNPVKRGLYLASLAHCMHCHAERKDDVPNYRTGAGRGGREFKTPTGVVLGANITSHPTAGIGSWTDAEIKRALTEGVSPGRTAARLHHGAIQDVLPPPHGRRPERARRLDAEPVSAGMNRAAELTLRFLTSAICLF